MADRLKTYKTKRDFRRSPEPKGARKDGAPTRAKAKAKQPARTRKKTTAPRFVVQEHHARRLHWDLRLEHDGALASWAIPNGIPEDPKQNRKAVRTEDHPLEYLEFHGEIPRGNYGAGKMTIWDHGTYEVHKFDDKKVEVTFHGRMHLTGEAQIRRLAKANPVSYVIFDLLWLDGHSLMRLPLAERRARLVELDLNGERWMAPEFMSGKGAEVLAASRAQGLEGIVAKRLDCPYEPGRRSRQWVKVKNVSREDVWIGGWMPGEGRRRESIGALLVGLPDGDGGLTYAGRVGTGFTGEELERLARLLGPLETKTSPFAGSRPPKGA